MKAVWMPTSWQQIEDSSDWEWALKLDEMLKIPLNQLRIINELDVLNPLACALVIGSLRTRFSSSLVDIPFHGNH